MLLRMLKLLCCCAVILLGTGCGENKSGENGRVLHLSAGGKIKTLDPALAADLLSQYMVASFYDTLLQYDYTARPYKLMPSMLAKMPEISADLLHYKFTLRDDLYFQDDPCFKGAPREQRKVTSKDVIYSILRIADARLHSPVYWMFRGKIKGLNEFRKRTTSAPHGDMAMYDKGCAGLEIIDNRTFVMHLTKPNPRMSYALAIPGSGVVSRTAVEYYGIDFQEHPVGSGPFRLVDWLRDYRIVLERNKDYRFETFAEAQNPLDRKRPLPLADKIVCYLVKQPLASWLMFLQGEMDMSTLDKDNFDAVVGDDRKLVKALRDRGITMCQIPEFQVRYIGFNFTDPLLADNLNLRKAISLAFNVPLREKHFNYQMIAANGPIPPGVPGYEKKFENPYTRHRLKLAAEFLRKAGYPNGIDPKTGHPLELTFDQGGTTSQFRQLAELMVEDMKKIGIKIRPVLNNRSRFFQKLRKGQFQLFRLSWVGDYPDAENFLQLFYSKNAGSCNRVFYRDQKFDRMFEEIMSLPDSPARTEKYRRMNRYITEQCPWIFEGYPIAYRLIHSWLENYIPHDFAFARWKYLTVDPTKRRQARKSFRPIEMQDLRN